MFMSTIGTGDGDFFRALKRTSEGSVYYPDVVRAMARETTEEDREARELIEDLSTWFTLEPGDVIATGTPPGVGFARKPPVYLKAGDVCEVEIDGLGVLRNPVAAFEA